jgi:hypothetical protein
MQKQFPKPLPRFSSMCNIPQTIGDIAGNLGLSLSQSELNQLVQAIGAGGQAGMAVALSIAESIAAANYQLTPKLVTTLMGTLNQGSHRNLQISHLLRLKLTHLEVRKL